MATTTLTKRVAGTASGGATVRVAETVTPTSLLLLEGDHSGYLLLEGDMQNSGTDRFKLEGDAAETVPKEQIEQAVRRELESEGEGAQTEARRGRHP